MSKIPFYDVLKESVCYGLKLVYIFGKFMYLYLVTYRIDW